MKRFLHSNGLALAMFTVFAVTIIAMSIAGWKANNDELTEHRQPELTYTAYISSGSFIEAVFENWESEFLQMWALVILTIFLYQKGSADSKPMRGKAPQDTSSRYSIIRSNWGNKGRAVRHAVYSHSLGLALLLLFIVSFSLHAAGGVKAYNSEAEQHGQPSMTVMEYVVSPQFWFESFQNWQSEFLAVGTLLVLSIYLRERGSQQSKPVGKAFNHTTGG